MSVARYVSNPQVADVDGPVVVIDVLRAFSTAAYAFAAGAQRIYLVSEVQQALRFKTDHPGALAVGEVGGLMPDGFDLPNSPVRAAQADLDGRVIVLRTSAGTQGVVAAQRADRLWCAGLVCATATARVVNAADLGTPTYVITGRFADRGEDSGSDDLLTAQHIEAIRAGQPTDPTHTARAVSDSPEAARTLKHGDDHVDPLDIAYSVDVDRFDFAMEVQRDQIGLRLNRVEP